MPPRRCLNNFICYFVLNLSWKKVLQFEEFVLKGLTSDHPKAAHNRMLAMCWLWYIDLCGSDVISGEVQWWCWLCGCGVA